MGGGSKAPHFFKYIIDKVMREEKELAMYPTDWENIVSSDWYEAGNRIWLCLRNKNAICEIEKRNKSVEILGHFPHNGLGETDLSLSVKKNGDYIVFCPFKANDIAMLKMSTGELEFIDLSKFIDKDIYINKGIEKFYRMVSYKEYVLFFGIKYPAIVRLNLKTKELGFFDGWLKEVEKYKCRKGIFFTDGYAQRESEIYLPIGKCNGVLKVNLDTMRFDYIPLEFDSQGILGMTQKENYVWLTEYNTRATKFIQWDLNNNEITQIGLPSQDAFYAPLYYRKSLLFFRNTGNRSYQYNLETRKWVDITDKMPEMSSLSDKEVRGEEIQYFSTKGKFFHCNLQTNNYFYDKFKIENQDFLKSSWEDYWDASKQKTIKEDILSLRSYIETIKGI